MSRKWSAKESGNQYFIIQIHVGGISTKISIPYHAMVGYRHERDVASY
jgi:hypothetical protein